MTGGSCVRLIATALVLGAPATTAHAVTPPTQSTVNANIIHPLTVTKLKDMDFGDLAAPTAGTAVLEPNADAFSTTGGALAVGGTPHCAEFLGAAQSNAVVNIKVPNQPITLTRVGGTETMTVSNFTLQGLSRRALAKAASFTFRVGGTLNVPANPAVGTYVGTFTVTVQYP
jgi:spore coat protein U-like protein